MMEETLMLALGLLKFKERESHFGNTSQTTAISFSCRAHSTLNQESAQGLGLTMS